MRSILFYVFFLFLSISAFAFHGTEKDSSLSSSDDRPERSFTVGIDFGSNKVFRGINQPMLREPFRSPNFTYNARSGFYIYMVGYYLSKAAHPWDELDLGAGWDVKLSKKYSVVFDVTRSFFNPASPQVNSSLTNNVEIYFKRRSSWLTSKLYFDYSFGTTSAPARQILATGPKSVQNFAKSTHDFSIQFDNYHSFDFDSLLFKKDELSIYPKINFTAGTVNFYSKFQVLKILAENKGKTVPDSLPAPKSKFRITAIELVLPVSYSVGKFTIEPAEHFIINVNQTKGRKSPPYFFFILSTYFTF